MDRHMLGLPKELALLRQTKLTLVVDEGAGHDPIKATGLVLAHLSTICHDTRPDKSQLWTLRTVTKRPEDPWANMTKAAQEHGLTANTLYSHERLTTDELSRNPLQ